MYTYTSSARSIDRHNIGKRSELIFFGTHLDLNRNMRNVMVENLISTGSPGVTAVQEC